MFYCLKTKAPGVEVKATCDPPWGPHGGCRMLVGFHLRPNHLLPLPRANDTSLIHTEEAHGTKSPSRPSSGSQ